jgi:hypothetical protein
MPNDITRLESVNNSRFESPLSQSFSLFQKVFTGSKAHLAPIQNVPRDMPLDEKRRLRETTQSHSSHE